MRIEKLRRQIVKENQIYIIPSAHGFLFLAGIAVIIMVAATYNNNLIFVLGFIMFSIFLVAMLQTHYNLRGVRLRFLSADDGFAGEPLALHFEITQTKSRLRGDLRIRPRGERLKTLSVRRVKLAPTESGKIARVEVVSKNRGIFKLPEVILETYYPLGLFRAWKVFRFTGEVVVYPSPATNVALMPTSYESGTEDLGLRTSPEGDFGELKSYLMGESYHQIAWKHYARTGELYSKVHWGEDHKHYVIPWMVSGRRETLESELGVMSGYIQMALEQNASFEMTTPDRRVDPGAGLEHARQCWRELAGYGGAA